jgi:(1->4)-alpha-D-glucan 1-alpha-D-glucosylmutase
MPQCWRITFAFSCPLGCFRFPLWQGSRHELPTSTYRIQFSPSFGFQDAKPFIAYLADLGISDLYASPIFKAVKGSSHGYDVVDPNRLNPELGDLADLEALAAELKK